MVRGFGVDETKYKELKEITKTKYLYKMRENSIKAEAEKLSIRRLKYP